MNIEVFNETNYDIEQEMNELKTFLENVAKDEQLDSGEFNVIVVDNKKIKQINKEYRNTDRETDVISFALEDDKTFIMKDYRVLGDIYISIDKVKEQAKNYNHSFKREFSFLALHGLLHLLGYDHMNKDDESIMFSKQEEVLNKYGILR